MRIWQWVGLAGVVALGVGAASGQTTNQAHLVPQLGSGQITAVAFSPDGHTILTRSRDKTARLWDAATGKQIRSLAGHIGRVNSVAFSPDGRFVLTGSDDYTAQLWDAATGKQIRSFVWQEHEEVTGVAFSPDGHFVLTSNHYKAVLWDAATGKQIRSFGHIDTDQIHAEPFDAVAFSPDGRFLLSGGEYDNTARLWDVTTGEQIRSFAGHTNWVDSVAFSPDGRFVLTSSNDNTARLWNAATGKQIRSFKDRKVGFNAVVSSPDGRFVLTANSNDARLWDAGTGKQIRSFEGHTDDVTSIAFSMDGGFVLTGSNDGTAKLWNATSGEQIRSFEGHSGLVEFAVFSPDGRFVLTDGVDAARLWDTAIGQQVRSFAGHIGRVNSVAFSPDGRYVITGSSDNTAWLWDVTTGKQIRSFAGHTSLVSSVAFSPDGRFVLTGSWDKTARLWDAATGRQIRSFEGHTGRVDSVAFSPDGRLVLTGSGDETGRLWDAATGQQIRTFARPKETPTQWGVWQRSVAFSPDGRFVLIGSTNDGTARLWDVATGQQVRSFSGSTDPVWSVAFSPDGRFVLTASYDNTAWLWDAATGEQIRAFVGHADSVWSVAFSRDGRYLLTGSLDRTTRLWNPATGTELATLISFENGGWAVVDAEGRFDTNNLDGGAPLAWVLDDDPMRALPLEIFMRDYYTPRLLARIMSGEELPPIRSIAEIKNRVQPDVSIVSVSSSKTQAGRVDVVAHAASRIEEKKDAAGVVLKDAQGKAETETSGLQDLRLFRNGQLVANTPLDHPLDDGDNTFREVQLPTAAKGVTFTAYAFNTERIKSPTAEKDYSYEPGTAAKSHAYLLQIGVNRYQAKGCDLHGSVTDAEELSRVLTEKLTGRGLDVRAVKLISDDKENGATKGRIKEALKEIAAEATPDDVFFLSFSGHGYSDKDGQFFILPSDIQGSCEGVDDAMLKGAISADELAEWLRPIDAGEMTFVLDSCQSASSVEANDFKPGPMGSRGLGQLAYDKRIRILAASQSNQAAHESESLHQGLLSFALTQEGLVEGKADWNPVDQKITVGEWLSYAADEVPKFREKGEVNTGRGLIPIGGPSLNVKSGQIPAVFDFSKKDTFVLQERGVPAGP